MRRGAWEKVSTDGVSLAGPWRIQGDEPWVPHFSLAFCARKGDFRRSGAAWTRRRLLCRRQLAEVLRAANPAALRMTRIFAATVFFIPAYCLPLRGHLIQSEVQFQNVDAGFAEQAEIALGGVLLDQIAEGGFPQSAFMGDAGDLKIGGGRGDVGIEAGRGCGDEIDGNGLRRIFLVQSLGVGLDAVD